MWPAVFLSVAVPSPAAEAHRPNVVVLMTDDQNVKAMRVMPKLRQTLHRQGTHFGNFFATTPRCCPSRATFLTGQYAHNHGVRGPRNFSAQTFRHFNDQRTLPIPLERARYRTGYIGKYLNGYGDGGEDPRYVPPGWDTWRAPVKGTATYQFDYVLNENGRLHNYGERARNYQTDVYARKAVRFIARSAHRPRPFFLTVAPSAPHGERNVDGLARDPRPAPRHRHRFEGRRLPTPPAFNERNVRDKPSFVRRTDLIDRHEKRALRERYQDRLASLLAVDDAVRRIVTKLRRLGELRNTVVFFTSDNGYLLGEHRLTEKTFLYEESVRVPLIVRGPGFPRGAMRPQLSGNIDLAPTILDLANAEPLRVMDGISLLPLARNARVAAKRTILLENAISSAVRTRSFMYANHPKGEEELYDLRRDPDQLRSRHRETEHRAVRARLAARLADLEKCSGEGCR